MFVYFNGEYMDKSQVSISPDDRGFLLGDSVYEVLRFYGSDFLEAQQHIERLGNSLNAIAINNVPLEKFIDVGLTLIAKNDLQGKDAIYYIQVTRGVAPRTHAFPKRKTSPTIYCYASPYQRNNNGFDNGIKACLVEDERWGRCDIKSTSLIANVLANQYAAEHQCGEAILYRQNVITEGTHTSIFAVNNGTVYYHPKGHKTLPGVTQSVIIELCKEHSIPLSEKAIEIDSLSTVDEMFLVGTTSEVTPIIQIDQHVIGNGKVGEVTKALQKLFIQYIAPLESKKS